MPGRKPKVVNKDVEVVEAPVIFRLKVSEEAPEEVIPVGETVSYSDILTAV